MQTSLSGTTIVAVASPPGVGAVSLLRISGPDARQVVGKCFRPMKAADGMMNWRPRYATYGNVVDEEGEPVDDVLATFFPGPHSFTGEDVIEISGHGGVVVTQVVLKQLLRCGAEPAEAGEFSQRAFLNGKVDLTQAEAIMDLISAQTELAARAAQHQLKGYLGDQMEVMRQALIGVLAHVEAYIDFPDEDIDPASLESILKQISETRAQVLDLLGTAEHGRILREGLRTVLCGAPNAGKSTLLNLLLGFERAIVHDEAGTTRDTIEESVSLRGIPLRLVDTAGIREGVGAVEREGIERSRSELESADLIIHVIDQSRPKMDAEQAKIPEGARCVRVMNKVDLEAHADWSSDNPGDIALSLHAEDARGQIEQFLFQRITESQLTTSHPVAINARHQACLRQTAEHLEMAASNLSAGDSVEFVAMDLRAALQSLGDVIGKTDTEEILGSIFSSFCIGK